MDPISALSVAVAVIDFVELGGKLVNTYFEVRSAVRGQPVEIVKLSATAADLSSVASTAQDKVKNLGSSYPRHADSLSRLTSEVTAVETKVKEAMAKLTVNPTSYLKKRGSQFLVAIRSVWSEAELEQWNKQLDRIRDQIMMNVLMCVWDETKKTDHRAESILQAVGRIEKAMEALKDDFGNVAAGRESLKTASQEKVYEAIWASTAMVDVPSDSLTPSPYTTHLSSRALSDASKNSQGRKKEFTRRLLRSLHFGEMNDRAIRIQTAFPNTFQWLFEEHSDKKDEENHPRLSFRSWLASKNETFFWINGVPASGKSTLMKFIAEHDQLEDQLKKWAGERKFHIAKFYFWNPGSKIQKSRVGLLRSLLYQLLNERPDLAEIVATRRRLYFDIAGENADPPEWEWTELRECLVRFAAELNTKGSRLAFFVDGLDEYEEFVSDNPQSLQATDEMVQFLMDLHENYGAKLCVSSRPLNYFRDKFKGHPNLTMQQLTQPDIDLYVEVRLQGSEAIQEIRDLEPEAVEELIHDLKTKAQGVFLWVVLVVEQLLLTSIDKPQINAVRKVFNELPADLNELYDTIQRQIGAEKAEKASKLYQLLMEWKRVWSGQMEATFLWLADLHDFNQPEYPTFEKESKIAKSTKRLLEGHTRGILQISEPPKPNSPATIDFLHKTAYEWIKEPDNRDHIIAKGPPNYHPILAILAVLVSHAGSLASCDKFTIRKQCVSRIFMLASEVPDSLDTRDQLVSIIDKLDPKLLKDLNTDGVFFQTPVLTNGRKAELNALTWAAAWACHLYLQAALNSAPKVSRTHRLSIFGRWAQPEEISLLETAIFGFRNYGSGRSSRDEKWFIGVRKLNAWHASQRLKTIKVLLQRGERIEIYVTQMLKKFAKDVPESSDEYKYAKLLLDLASHRDTLKEFDEKVQSTFETSDVVKAHVEWLFPDYSIAG